MVRKTSFNLYVDFELMDMFERKVGQGNASQIIEELMRSYLKLDKAKVITKQDFLEDLEEQEAELQINTDPYNKMKFEYEKSKDKTLTAVGFLKRLDANFKS